jgi:hypothetical protein
MVGCAERATWLSKASPGRGWRAGAGNAGVEGEKRSRAKMAQEQVDKLITFGKMALEQGWYDQAREYFEQALALDASNREAMKGLARVNEILSRSRPSVVQKTQARRVVPAESVKSIRVRETPMRLGFWLRVICTLGLYLLVWQSRYIEVTGRRLVYHSGLLAKRERAVMLDKILDISVSQGFLGRIFGYGDIAVETAAGPLTEFVFQNAAHPVKFREAIMGRMGG